MGMRKIKPEGGKENSGMDVPASAFYPQLYISTEHLPEAKDWKVGKTYKVTFNLKQTGMSMRKGRDGKEHGSADFDIVGLEVHGKASDGTRSRYTDDE